MLSNRVSKSPTSVAAAPANVLDPLVLKRTSSRSGNVEVERLVQKLSSVPLVNCTSGVISQLLMMPVPASCIIEIGSDISGRISS